MRFTSALALLCALLLVTALPAAAATRPFAPVQDGPTSSAPEMPEWIPGRVLVQFEANSFQIASLPQPGEKAGGPLQTGLASLDAVLADVGARNARVAFPTAALNKSLAGDLGVNRWFILDLDPAADVPAVAARLMADPALAEALPDLVAFPAAVPNDTDYPDNWGHNNTAQLPEFDWGGTWAHTGPGVGTLGFDSNAQSAWNGAQGYGDPAVIIAILDSGVDSTHPDLLQMAGYDFGDNDNDPHDDSASPGHGTACAGVAAAVANNALGAAGIAGGCTIMPLKVADSAGSLGFSYITNAIYHAADNGADVISMSFGAATTAYAPTDAAISYASGLGCVLLAATGNENASQISYPAYNPNVIGVGAASPCGDRKRSSSSSTEVNPGVNTDPNGSTCDEERWWGSNYGSAVQDHQGAVDIIAPTILPTTDIQGAGGYDPGNYSSFFNGTSCATPYAAGVAALIKSANPGFTAGQVRNQLLQTAQDVVSVESGAGWDRYTGYGMVDAAAAVNETVVGGAVAAFTAVDSVGCAPFTVQFIDESTGDITSRVWNFGDGLNGSGTAPSHTYDNPGTYSVTLTVTSPYGDDVLTKVDFIVAGDTPGVAFSQSTNVITAGQSIDFTDETTGDPTAWAWDFGDGGSSTEQNPTHQYVTPGAFSVKLVATNACGPDSFTSNFSVVVGPPPAPVAAFSSTPAGGCAPVTVDFTDESTGLIDSWAWDFGDGGTATAQNPSHEYTAAGSYDVTLVVTNAGGADTLTVAAAAVVDGAPTAAFAASDSTVGIGDTVTFTDASTGDPTGWAWNFGDGGSSSLQNPDHAYTAAGTYTVTLIATNGCGADTLVATDLVAVADLAGPVAAFSADPAAGCAPVEVTFTDESLNDVSGWAWDFGDGGTATEQNPVHTYVAPGSYDVTLIVTGAGGADTLTVAGAVDVGTPVVAAFTWSDTLITYPNDVTFTDASTGSPTAWLWDFGDGATDTLQSPTHTYTGNGNFDVTLIVSNGCSSDTLVAVGAIWVNGPSGVGDVVKARFGLGAAYPNPFNPSTTIVFNLEKAAHARLEIFDLSGRRVATLVDADRTAGRHEVAWRPHDLASGVYFSRLSAGGQSDTRRLTLLK